MLVFAATASNRYIDFMEQLTFYQKFEMERFYILRKLTKTIIL